MLEAVRLPAEDGEHKVFDLLIGILLNEHFTVTVAKPQLVYVELAAYGKNVRVGGSSGSCFVVGDGVSFNADVFTEL